MCSPHVYVSCMRSLALGARWEGVGTLRVSFSVGWRPATKSTKSRHVAHRGAGNLWGNVQAQSKLPTHSPQPQTQRNMASFGVVSLHHYMDRATSPSAGAGAGAASGSTALAPRAAALLPAAHGNFGKGEECCVSVSIWSVVAGFLDPWEVRALGRTCRDCHLATHRSLTNATSGFTLLRAMGVTGVSSDARAAAVEQVRVLRMISVHLSKPAHLPHTPPPFPQSATVSKIRRSLFATLLVEGGVGKGEGALRQWSLLEKALPVHSILLTPLSSFRDVPCRASLCCATRAFWMKRPKSWPNSSPRCVVSGYCQH